MSIKRPLKTIRSKKNVSEVHFGASVPEDDKCVLRTTATTSDYAVPYHPDPLKGAWTADYRDLPRAQGTENVLNSIGDVRSASALSSGQPATVDTPVVPTKGLINTPQIADTILKEVDAVMEAIPSLVKALEEVGKTYPFTNVAILTFAAAYTLEKERCEHNIRVLVLYAEMKNMMEVLLGLRDIPKPGQITQGRMGKLCEDVAKDIKECVGVCDAYLSRKILVKIFAGPIWEGKLIDFVKVFAERREELKFEIQGIDATNLRLGAVDQQTAEISGRVDVMRHLFKKFVNPQQESLAAKVKEMGGEAALENEQTMKELARAESALVTSQDPEGQPSRGSPFNIAELRQEIKDGPEEAVEKNSEFFYNRFDVLMRGFGGVNRALGPQGDRNVSAVTAGAYDLIVDPDIREIWKERRWHRIVKAKHFVTTLGDYYVHKARAYLGSTLGPDAWALGYTNIGRMRSITEALPNGADKFVTVDEVNDFVQSKPLDWSLLRWMAYWAIGWQMTCTAYCVKIEEIFDAMIRLSYKALPENHPVINNYVDEAWKLVTKFIQSIEREEGPEELGSKFESYVAAEESRLEQSFEDINYLIDSPNVVQVISGTGRLETTILPMFYLALRRDLEKISLAQKYVLSESEFSSTPIYFINSVAQDRMASLKAIFEYKSLEAKDQFKIFAKGLYCNASAPGGVHQPQELSNPIPCRGKMLLDLNSIPLSILNHREKWHEINSAYNPPELMIRQEKNILSNWITCDNCLSTLKGSRVICMDCRHNETTPMNLCSKPSCVNCTIKFAAPGQGPHLPTHKMFKVHRFIFLRDMARTEGTAMASLCFVRGLISCSGDPRPECIHCKAAVSPPCWSCTECLAHRRKEAYICDNCEDLGLAFGKGHTKMHTMVRIFGEDEGKE